MKVTKGFISNSSTSSFICDICGDVEAGMDMELYDCDAVECVNGHTFHESCGDIELYSLEICKAYHELLYKKEYITGKEYLEAKDNPDFDYVEWAEEEGELRYYFPSDFCPICKMEKFTDSDLAAYTYKKIGGKEKVSEEIKNRFDNYEEFSSWLK